MQYLVGGIIGWAIGVVCGALGLGILIRWFSGTWGLND